MGAKCYFLQGAEPVKTPTFHMAGSELHRVTNDMFGMGAILFSWEQIFLAEAELGN